MITYSVTVKVDHLVAKEWLSWMKDTHIPDVMATGYFESHSLHRVLVQEDDGITFNIQYRSADRSNIENYQNKEAPRLQQEHREKFDGHFVAFRTLLEEV